MSIRTVILIGSTALALSACSLTAAQQAEAQKIITVACKADAYAPDAIKAGGVVATIVNPTGVGIVGTVNAVDAAAHPLVQNACQQALAGSTPIPGTVATVTVPAAPVSTP